VAKLWQTASNRMPAENTPVKRVSIPWLLPAGGRLSCTIATHADWQCVVMIRELRPTAEYRLAVRRQFVRARPLPMYCDPSRRRVDAS